MNKEWITPENILSVYASVIATISLVWNIISIILEKRSKIKVRVEVRSVFVNNPLIGIEQIPDVLYIQITNKSKHTKYIDDIRIVLPYETQIGNKFSLVSLSQKMPIELSSEQCYIYKFSVAAYNSEHFLENYKKGNCRIIVVDTISKEYKSNRFSSEQLYNAISRFRKK